MKEVFTALQTLKEFSRKDGHRFANFEGNRGCNRRCEYCDVPENYDPEQELTVKETLQVIDWLHNQGYRLISWVGGEPLAPFITKEGESFFDHSRQLIQHATAKGMIFNLTTNGDYLTGDKVEQLKRAGLQSLTLSLHTFTKPALDHLIKGAKMVAQARIVPTINVVLTTKTAEIVPGLAAETARNGIPFSGGLVQEKGGGFSKTSKESLLPSLEEQIKIFRALLRLKSFGFIRPGRGYLENAPDYYPNNWRCDPENDAFIHIGSGGIVNVCSDVRTGLTVAELDMLSNPRWREEKRVLVRDCGGCLYQCYYDAQNPTFQGEVAFTGVALLIKAGQARLARKWGEFAVEACKKLETGVDWNLDL